MTQEQARCTSQSRKKLRSGRTSRTIYPVHMWAWHASCAPNLMQIGLSFLSHRGQSDHFEIFTISIHSGEVVSAIGGRPLKDKSQASFVVIAGQV